jgi:hypothetical protein
VVHDPAGDATASVQGATAADAKRVTITYDPAGGTLEVEEKLWSPAPSFYSLKTLFAFQGCSPSSPQVLDYDTGGSAILRIAGIGIPLNVTYQRETRGTRQTETWSGPELKGLDIGCVRASVATGGPGAYGIDELADIELD